MKRNAPYMTSIVTQMSLVAILVSPALAQQSPSQDIQRQRQEIVEAILTSDDQHTVEKERWLCINRLEPSRVTEARASGFNFTPDAFDSCLAALERNAGDKQLTEIYQKLLLHLGGTADGYQTFPKAVGAAVLSGNGKVIIGNGLSATITPQLAFDAGFTVAYEGAAAKREGVDMQKLKAVAENCLNVQGDAGTCFSVGYVYGSQAIKWHHT